MFVDAQNLFSDAQAVTAAAGSTNTLDLGAVRDIGTGTPLFLVIVVDVAMTDSGSDSTVTVAIEGDTTTTFTPDGTANVLTIPAISAAGTQFIVPLAPGLAPLQYRYIRLLYTPNGSDLTAGTFTAFLTHNIQKYTSYADGITIS